MVNTRSGPRNNRNHHGQHSAVATTATKPQYGAIYHSANVASARTHYFYAADLAKPAEPAAIAECTQS
jgi:hypothetical protein